MESFPQSPAAVQGAIEQTCAAFTGRLVTVCGDLLLDEYIWGDAERISPEAPVPVVRVVREEIRLGGAGNVARNIASLGGHPLLVGVVGPDATGDEIRQLWAAEGHEVAGILTDDARITPRKTRVLASGQQMLRVDRELSPARESDALEELRATLEVCMNRAEAGLFSDYQKGTLGPRGTASLVESARGSSKPLLANPKPASAALFAHTRLVSLNRSEALGLLSAAERGIDLDVAGEQLRQSLGVAELLITRGGEGMTWFGPEGQWHVPAVTSEVFDVTGAGDTVLAALGMALAAGVSTPLACLVATFAAGVVVRKIGVATVTPAEIIALAGRQQIAPTWVPAGPGRA